MNITHTVRNSLAAAVVAGGLLLAPAAHARVFVSVGVAPPAIPVYVQPPAPSYGYIWTPGYWAYGPNGYYWVDGAWVLPPYEGALWTPGYWGWADDAYFWNPGYWGLTVGYYGGINYGFGYFGTGFYGGYWRDRHFFYNAEYNRFGFRDHDGFIYRQHYGRFDGRPGGSSFSRNDGRGFAGRDFNRGATVNGRNFASAGRTEQVGFRNGYTTNGGRSGYSSGFRDNGQQFRGGVSAQQQTRFGQGGDMTAAPQYRGGAPQARFSNGGGNFGAQSRGSYSAPAAPQGRSFGGNFGGASGRGSFGGGGNSGGGGGRASFGGGGNSGGGFRGGGGGGGGFHGGGGHR